MIRLSDLQILVARTLKDSAEYTTLCVDTVGSALTYYTDSSIKRADEVIPYAIVHKINKSEADQEQDEWLLQLIIGIHAEEKSIEDDGIWVYPSTNHLETLADKAVELVNCELGTFGVSGEMNIRIFGYNILITEIGEAEDVQAIVTLRLTNYSLL